MDVKAVVFGRISQSKRWFTQKIAHQHQLLSSGCDMPAFSRAGCELPRPSDLGQQSYLTSLLNNIAAYHRKCCFGHMVLVQT